MKMFTNKKIWQKIVIVMLLILFFQLFATTPVHAIAGDVLLEPVTGLFANLGDAIMEIMQKTFLGIKTSGAWVEQSSNLWLKILTIAAAIIIAVVAVIATIYSGGSALYIFLTAFGAVVKIAAGATIAYFAVDKLYIGASGIYLPEYYLTPETIFKNEVLAFDVNFFNPREEVITEGGIEEKILDDSSLGNIDPMIDNNRGYIYIKNDVDTGESAKIKLTPENLFRNFIYTDGTKISKSDIEATYESEKKIYNGYNESEMNTCSEGCPNQGKPYAEHFFSESDYHFHNLFGAEENKHYVTMQKGYLKYKSYDNVTYKMDATIVRCYINGIKSINDAGFNYDEDLTTVQVNYKFYKIIEKQDDINTSPARILQPVISAWYVTLRNIALVSLLSVLVYIGIRITLSSVASDKAKYKQMLIDWTTALCLVFLMHYIMSFAVTINEKIIDSISSITTSNSYNLDEIKGKKLDEADYKTKDSEDIYVDEEKVKDKKQTGVQLFIIDDKDIVKKAYDTLVGDKGADSSFYNRFTDEKKGVLIWPANDFMTQARILGQATITDEDLSAKEAKKNEEQTAVARAGYNIIYVVLVIFTIIFCFTYLKRLIYLAFLTIIAPLVAITYPIDKLNDGQAQAFNMWLKEYIFNLLMQPMHLILYTILIGSAMEFASVNIFYVVVALGFLMPAEKLLRKFFGFGKAETPGVFDGAAGAALMMSGLNRLMNHKSRKPSLGSGGNNKGGDGVGDDEAKTPPWKDKDYDATDNLVGIGGDDNPGEDNIPEQDNVPELDPESNLEYDSRLTEEQLDELKAEGIEPGDQEYDQYLRQHGIDPNEEIEEDPAEGNIDLPVDDNTNNTGGSNVTIPSQSSTPRTNTSVPSGNYRKRSIIRGIKRGTRTYLRGMGQKMVANYKASGGIGRKIVEEASGLATAALTTSAAGFAAIVEGKPSSFVKYGSVALLGGRKLGKTVASNTMDKLKVEGTLKDGQKAYYGDDHKEVQQEKYKKAYMKDEENLRKIEDKLKVERKEAKRIMEENMSYYLDHEVSNIEDAIATYKLEKEEGMNREQAVAIAQYANQVMNGEDTRTMTAKRKKEYKDTFKSKFKDHGSKNPDGDVDEVFKKLDKFYKHKK